MPADAARARIAKLVARFALEPHLHRRAADLPLGIRQRLSLAVAIVHSPDLLVLDEPTSGVDPVARDEIWRELLNLSRQEGITIFVSTHFMNEAARCDRVALMTSGRVLAISAPAELVAAKRADNLEEAFVRYLEEGAEGRTARADGIGALAAGSASPCSARRSSCW
ncbi:MAG TPA: AAA family ATPase [Enterovirga sp.]|nr:AAA family ATPase [Enterovirga sp.]